MSNYSDVTLIVLSVHKEQALEIIKPIDGEPFDECGEPPDRYWFQFANVKYGDLVSLPKLLDAGIPFIAAWEESGEYGGGTDYGWFTEEGEQQTKRVYEADINPDIEQLIRMIHYPDVLVGYIKAHYEHVSPIQLTPEQEHYGKLFLAKKLISP